MKNLLEEMGSDRCGTLKCISLNCIISLCSQELCSLCLAPIRLNVLLLQLIEYQQIAKFSYMHPEASSKCHPVQYNQTREVKSWNTYEILPICHIWFGESVL